jgi:CubicO group peptidase (beta-lactamase class C family)
VSKNRIQTWLALIVLGVGVLLAAAVGLFVYVSATPPLHPNPQDVPSVTHAAPSPEWTDAVEQGRQIVRAGLKDLPGLSVAVGVDGEIVWAEGFGWADLENRSPVAPDTRFRIGTASKVFTSAAVGLLLEKDRLKLDERIQTYVPEFPEKQWPVTVRQLMGHLAGVRTDAGDEGPLGVRCERTVEGLHLDRFAERPLLFEPGTQYRYSNYGWILVSAAVEAAADEPFYTFMRKQIFEPLGMDDTRADSATEPIPNRATFYFPRFAADPRYGLHLTRRIDYSCYTGSSAFLSTPSDLVRFGMAIDSGKLLQPATVRMLQTSQRLASGQETGYGLGWDLETVALAGEQTRLVGYDGTSMGGMMASLMTFHERGLVIAVTSNIAFADTFSTALRIAQAFAELRARPARQGHDRVRADWRIARRRSSAQRAARINNRRCRRGHSREPASGRDVRSSITLVTRACCSCAASASAPLTKPTIGLPDSTCVSSPNAKRSCRYTAPDNACRM